MTPLVVANFPIAALFILAWVASRCGWSSGIQTGALISPRQGLITGSRRS
jgi:hypothetical protein